MLLYIFLKTEGGYTNGDSLQQLCGPFTSACVTPSLSPYEWFYSNAARGLFERQVGQKAERTFFFFFTKPDSCLHPQPLQANQ